MPQKIEALGIAVSASQKDNLLQVLAGVIAFFVAGFWIYALADLRRRDAIASQASGRVRPVMEEAMKQYQFAEQQWKDAADSAALFRDDRFLKIAALSDQSKLAQRVSRIGVIRIVFDVYLPLLIGFSTILTILATTRHSPIARVIEAILGFGLPALATFLLWRSRQRLLRWARVKVRHFRDKRFERAMQDFKLLPDGHPRKAVLQERAKTHLERKLEDLKNGIY